MAWGKGSLPQGLDDICHRLSNNDGKLCSLTILKHRKFDNEEVLKLCRSLEGNTVLKELYASNHAVSMASAAAISGMLVNNSTLTSLCIGERGKQPVTDETFGYGYIFSMHDCMAHASIPAEHR